MRVLFDRLQRRFRDRVGIALEAHVARLQATVATIEHHERPEYLDRLAVLRDQVFALDHLFLSLFSTVAWIFRLVFTMILLASVDPALMLLAVFAVPTVAVASWRPWVERETEEAAAPSTRLARHLFVLGTTAAPARRCASTGNGAALMERRRAVWEDWYAPVARVRWSALRTVPHGGATTVTPQATERRNEG